MEEDKFIDKIRPLAQQLHNLHQIQLDWAKKEVNLILKQNIKDIPRIEQVAEVLLEAALFGIGLEEFRSFMRYLWFEVDQVMAEEYILLYKLVGGGNRTRRIKQFSADFYVYLNKKMNLWKISKNVSRSTQV